MRKGKPGRDEAGSMASPGTPVNASDVVALSEDELKGISGGGKAPEKPVEYIKMVMKEVIITS
jgi:hypothetical protein